jgi:hypothetical protein
MALTDVKVRNTKPESKQTKLFDYDGLFLLVLPPGKKTPNGSKCWRFKYRFGGKEKLLALGTYPEISLAEARDKRDAARKQLANGIDPGEVRKAQKASKNAETENAFEVVAREWHGKFVKTWSAVHASTIMDRLEKEVFPWLGACSIEEIKAPELLKVLRRMESRGASFVMQSLPAGRNGIRLQIYGERCRL